MVTGRQVNDYLLSSPTQSAAPKIERLLGACLADERRRPRRRKPAIEPIRLDIPVDTDKAEAEEHQRHAAGQQPPRLRTRPFQLK